MGIQKTEYRRRVRKQCIESLGGRCAWCGFSDWRALQVDHIKGGGTKERKANSNSGTITKQLQIIKNPDRSKYQILCANCNWIKRYENHE